MSGATLKLALFPPDGHLAFAPLSLAFAHFAQPLVQGLALGRDVSDKGAEYFVVPNVAKAVVKLNVVY